MTDSNELRGRLGARKMSISKFASLMGWSRPTARRKVDGESTFTVTEMYKACEILGISPAEAAKFFLANK